MPVGSLRGFPSRLPNVPSRLPPRKKIADDFYSSAEWRGLMKRIIAERGRRCEICGKSGARIYGDHIIELKDGGAPLDPANVRLVDARCHGIKTAIARKARKARLEYAHEEDR